MMSSNIFAVPELGRRSDHPDFSRPFGAHQTEVVVISLPIFPPWTGSNSSGCSKKIRRTARSIGLPAAHHGWAADGIWDSMALLEHYPRPVSWCWTGPDTTSRSSSQKLFEAITSEWLDRVEDSRLGAL